ncbi:DUF2442 domain-containing protein [Devosia sp. YIM 151766]|uniref:DUF2442 domain-containing protein n=1 Tax=Devosia sp. YIM 151766 TaxID=3017325 RepID=UPI00255C6DB8|nr:DUF2442 domain-containing protein [Devosia sp. YIM 151766]WIY54383.1 DUF2442 domain-containing protein [Devosia sp. YIM 151766]
MTGPDGLGARSKVSETDRIEDDDFVEVGAPMPVIRSAEAVGGFVLRIEWVDGRQEDIDVGPAILSHRAFVALRNDPAAFAAFTVWDRGDCLVWPDGQELSAVWIEELAPGKLDNAEFREAMAQLRLSLDGMAARLGIARRLVADYRKDRPIPKTVALATRYLLEHQQRTHSAS